MKEDREIYFFVDVQARGEYPAYAGRALEREGLMPVMEDGDERILKKGTVDFISFSYYNSRCVSTADSAESAEGNLFASA